MDTLSFFTRILGSGLIMLAVPFPGGSATKWKHFAYETPEEAAEAAAAFNAKGLNVYHACATYLQPYLDVEEKGKKKRAYRTRANVARVKALWLDLDCGEGKDYSSQAAAITDVSRFIHETGLPEPMLVNSGNGVHCYWAFEKAIAPDLWVKLATRFRGVVDKFGVKQDGVCTSDVCRILRPVGTDNRKAEPKPVVLIQDADVITDLPAFAGALKALSGGALEVETPPTSVLALLPSTSDLSYKADYPPSSAREILKRCGQVEAFATVQGDVSEPMWYGMLGLLKHTVEGEEICQEWSKGHPQYSADATREKMAQWPHGPTTCEHFSKINAARCEGCRHRGDIKSPISLGQVLPEMQPAVTVDAETGEETEIPFELPESMEGLYSWDGAAIYAMGFDKKGLPTVTAFCDYLFWPIGYHRTDNKTRMAWRLREPSGRLHDFELSGSSISTGGVPLFTELGDHGIVARSGQKKHMENYVTDWFNELKKKAEETTVYNHFGWQRDWSFVLGDTRYLPDGTQEEVRLSADAALPIYRDAFVPQGSLEEWKGLIDAAYNYPGQEQYQFIFGVGFGAPLVRLFENYGGITVHGYSPEKGLGKSTALKLALGIYGNPKLLNRTKQQVTPKAYIAHCGIMHSLPVGIDEATNIDPRELSDTIYNFSLGTPRTILYQTGRLNTGQHSWSTIQIWTANRSLINVLGAHKVNADAEMGRLLEFQFTKVSKFSKAEADTLLARAETLYGHAGQVFIKHLVTNREKVLDLLLVAQRKIDAMVGYTVQDRFASIGLAATIVGLVISKQLGLHDFDVNKVLTWAVAQAKLLQDSVALNNPPMYDVIGRMLTEISSGFIVTHNEGDARNLSKVAVVVKAPNAAITGRLIQETGELYVQLANIRQWCAKHQADYGEMWKVALKQGWVQPEVVHYSLGKGTKEYGLAPTRCWKFDVAKMNGESATFREPTPLRAVK